MKNNPVDIKKFVTRTAGLLCLAATLWNCNGKNESAGLPPVQDIPVQIEAGGEVDPIAGDGAIRGGVLNLWGGPFPKTLNSWLENWATVAEINSLMFHGLVDLHSTADRPVGDLAASWKMDADGRTFTFNIHPEAKWSDGQPITAEDIQYYYDVIMDEKNLTTIYRVVVGRFERPEVVDAKTVRIVAKEKYWKAFWDAGSFVAFPKHAWQGQDFNKISFEFPVVSGPYKLTQVRRNRFALLERRADWWGRVKLYNKNKYNFDYIRYKFMEDRNAALEAFKKGDYDTYAVYTASTWAQQTNFEDVQNGYVVRQEISNKEPRGFQGIAINMRRPQFQDVRVRRALQYLLDRESLNEKLMFNQYILLNSYFPDLYPGYVNPKAELRLYNPEKARKLLDEAGWTVGKNGIREKDGQQLTATFLTYASDQRHMNVYLEDLKKAGIVATTELLSMTEVQKRLDEFNFDLFWVNTGASRLRDPEPMFRSDQADQKSSFNYAGVKDAQVDAILVKLQSEFNLAPRDALIRQLDQRLDELSPFILLWQSDRTRLLYWNKFGTPRYVLNKFNRENTALVYWWYDPKKIAALDEAMKTKQPLPKEPETIIYKD